LTVPISAIFEGLINTEDACCAVPVTAAPDIAAHSRALADKYIVLDVIIPPFHSIGIEDAWPSFFDGVVFTTYSPERQCIFRNLAFRDPLQLVTPVKHRTHLIK
jgi:hypothetical protein